MARRRGIYIANNTYYMKLKSVLIGAIIVILLIPTTHVFARDLTDKERESGFYRENGSVISNTKERPTINPDFDPDEDCNLAYELKCIPGTEQECPEGYHRGDDTVCSPIECQEGYHGEEDDETGLCYPDDEGCSQDDYVLIERDDGNGMICAYFYSICDEAEHSSKEYCIEWCEEKPDRFACKPESTSGGEEIIYDKNADLPICVYKEIKDCKTRSGLICEVETTIDPCEDIFHGFTGTDENYKPETNQFIVPDN